MIKRFASFLAAVSLPIVLFAVGVASAQETGLDVRIREVSFTDAAQTRLVVSVSGPALTSQALGPDNFTVREEDQQIPALAVEQLFQSNTQPVAVSVLVDVSRSTRDKLEAAKAAVKRFVDALPPQVRVGLISFGNSVDVRSPLTTLNATGSGERGALAGQIDALAPADKTGTKLYDAVVEAGRELGRQFGAQHNIFIFSDGSDAGSTASLDEAVAAVESAKAPATSVLLSTRTLDEAPLKRLARAEKGGEFLKVENTAALDTAFAGIAQAISSQYVVTYRGNLLEPRDLDISVAVALGDVVGRDSSVVINERPNLSVTPAEPPKPLVPLFASRGGLVLGILAAFGALLMFIGMLFYRPEGKRAEQLLARGLRLYTRGAKKEKAKKSAEGGFLSGTAVGRAAVDLAERMPRSKQFDEKMQKNLDQAGWPLRSSEFVLFQVGGVIVGAILGFGLFQSPIVGVFLAILGGVAPRLALSNRQQKRASAFLEQLPDTLQLLAGSLQAGYGFLQGLDTVAKEANPPTSTEFARVLSEARLGMPIEDALDDMAERVGGEDFKWVVLAINIQRQVGGNLAALLHTVADTLREREQVRRQIKVLSAEGRLSAVILVALPFVLVGYLSVVNPNYLSQLTSETIGKIAIAIALVLIGIGVVWMRKIIKIDV